MSLGAPVVVLDRDGTLNVEVHYLSHPDQVELLPGAADAFDAMTSARAYRQGRPASDAVRELWRCAGSQFDAEVVQALATSLPALDGLVPAAAEDEVGRRPPRLAIVHGGAGS
jgi:hypothetical protein